jgi:putative transposase
VCQAYEAKYPQATECLRKDRDVLFTFYDSPLSTRKHIRTTNRIESPFSTVRLRTNKTRGCVSRAGMLAIVFKLTNIAEQKWRSLKGHPRLAKVVRRVNFKDRLQVEEAHKVAA